ARRRPHFLSYRLCALHSFRPFPTRRSSDLCLALSFGRSAASVFPFWCHARPSCTPCRHVSIYQRLLPYPLPLDHVCPCGLHRNNSHPTQLRHRILHALFAPGDRRSLPAIYGKTALHCWVESLSNRPPI